MNRFVREIKPGDIPPKKQNYVIPHTEAKGAVYRCLDCNRAFGTTFIADGLKCPYCGGLIVTIGKVITRQEYTYKVKELKRLMRR